MDLSKITRVDELEFDKHYTIQWINSSKKLAVFKRYGEYNVDVVTEYENSIYNNRGIIIRGLNLRLSTPEEIQWYEDSMKLGKVAYKLQDTVLRNTELNYTIW